LKNVTTVSVHSVKNNGVQNRTDIQVLTSDRKGIHFAFKFSHRSNVNTNSKSGVAA